MVTQKTSNSESRHTKVSRKVNTIENIMERQGDWRVICVLILCMLSVGRAQIANPDTSNEQNTCVQKARETADVCSNVMNTNDPFGLLNCCNLAKEANDLKCFCRSDVTLELGSLYDFTIDVLRSGCEINLATYGTVGCIASDTNSDGVALQPSSPDVNEEKKQSSQKGKGSAQNVSGSTPKPSSLWNFKSKTNTNLLIDSVGEIDGILLPDSGKNRIQLDQEGPNSKLKSGTFDGTDNFVLISYSPILNEANFSIAAIVKPKTISRGLQTFYPESIVNNFYKMSNETVVVGGYGIERQWVDTGSNSRNPKPRWAFLVGTPLGPQILLSTSEAKDGKWAQVLGVFDQESGTAYLYVDGKLENTLTIQGMLGNPESNMLIGKGGRALATGGESVSFAGKISQVAYFTDALTEQQASDYYTKTFKEESRPSKLPEWGILLIVGLSITFLVGAVAGLLLWRARKWRNATETGEASSSHAAVDVTASPKHTPLNEEKEELTPKRTPSATLHPRFKKVGSRISVTWNDALYDYR